MVRKRFAWLGAAFLFEHKAPHVPDEARRFLAVLSGRG